jgi:hypothetical protein
MSIPEFPLCISFNKRLTYYPSFLIELKIHNKIC